MTCIEIALNEYATHDILGVNNNNRILDYFSAIGHKWVKNDDTPWCAAFANWVLLKAGLMGTGKLNARSFLNYGVSTDTPELGDLVVLWRITKDSPYGHVGFFIREVDGIVYILGGNQSNQVNITPFLKERVLGYRKPPLAHHA